MDPTRFDALTRAMTDRIGQTPSRRSLLHALGGGFVAAGLIAAPKAEAKRKKHKKKKQQQCNPSCDFNLTCQNGACVAAPDRCPEAFVCSGFGGDAPVCGTVAGGGNCGCYQSTEGNNVCLNDSDDIHCQDLEVCTTSQDCRDGVSGFHFFCRKALANENEQFCGCDNGRCWPECDNPN